MADKNDKTVSLTFPTSKPMTREESVKLAKEKFLSMTIADKRILYRCGSDYTISDFIPTWYEYYKKKDGNLPETKISDDYVCNNSLNKKVTLWKGDITRLEIDAIVNAANESLLGGGGVDGAIHRAAGSQLLAECKTFRGCDTGSAEITGGYKLPSKYIIHTVGPRGFNPSKLESCYKSCLQLLKDNNLKSIAFPCISTGIFGYPNKDACQTALKMVRNWLEKNDDIEQVVFCLFLKKDVELYEEYMQKYFPIDADIEEDELDKELLDKLPAPPMTTPTDNLPAPPITTPTDKLPAPSMTTPTE